MDLDARWRHSDIRRISGGGTLYISSLLWGPGLSSGAGTEDSRRKYFGSLWLGDWNWCRRVVDGEGTRACSGVPARKAHCGRRRIEKRGSGGERGLPQTARLWTSAIAACGGGFAGRRVFSAVRY